MCVFPQCLCFMSCAASGRARVFVSCTSWTWVRFLYELDLGAKFWSDTSMQRPASTSMVLLSMTLTYCFVLNDSFSRDNCEITATDSALAVGICSTPSLPSVETAVFGVSSSCSSDTHHQVEHSSEDCLHHCCTSVQVLSVSLPLPLLCCDHCAELLSLRFAWSRERSVVTLACRLNRLTILMQHVVGRSEPVSPMSSAVIAGCADTFIVINEQRAATKVGLTLPRVSSEMMVSSAQRSIALQPEVPSREEDNQINSFSIWVG